MVLKVAGRIAVATAITLFFTFAAFKFFALPVHSPNLMQASVNTDAVFYVHYEGGVGAAQNLQFFVNHALHDHVDFYFIINGYDTNQTFPNAPNIHVIRRENTCYDLGSYGVVLEADDQALMKKYKRFIFSNSSIRGPFFPTWARALKKACWTSNILSLLQDNVKLVGMTANCFKSVDSTQKHLQSMLLAVDTKGLELIRPALQCFQGRRDAIDLGELALTNLVRDAGFDAMPLYAGYYAGQAPKSPADFWSKCDTGDVFFPAAYGDGMDVHPFDTMFTKVARPDMSSDSASGVGMAAIRQLTAWADESEFSSYEQC